MTPNVETSLRRRIDELVKKHGGFRPAARALKLGPQYLWRLWAGEKDNPSDAVMRKLGVYRVVTYYAKRSTGDLDR
jgi:hypothetical protein